MLYSSNLPTPIEALPSAHALSPVCSCLVPGLSVLRFKGVVDPIRKSYLLEGDVNGTIITFRDL